MLDSPKTSGARPCGGDNIKWQLWCWCQGVGVSTCYLWFHDIRLLVLPTHITSCSGGGEWGEWWCARWCQCRLYHHAAKEQCTRQGTPWLITLWRDTITYTRGFIWLRVRCILLAAVAACFMFAHVLGFTCEIQHQCELCRFENRLSCNVVQMYFKYIDPIIYSCISTDLFCRVC